MYGTSIKSQGSIILFIGDSTENSCNTSDSGTQRNSKILSKKSVYLFYLNLSIFFVNMTVTCVFVFNSFVFFTDGTISDVGVRDVSVRFLCFFFHLFFYVFLLGTSVSLTSVCDYKVLFCFVLFAIYLIHL